MPFELRPNNRDAPDAELLADLRKVADELGVDSLTQADYDEHGRFSSATIKKRFRRWNEALTAAGLSMKKLMNVSNDALLDELRRVAVLLTTTKLTASQYRVHGRYGWDSYPRRFGSWKGALSAAGLETAWNYGMSEDELFENLERVWVQLGRQPGREDMRPPVSMYSHGPYTSRFGTWRKALEAFVVAVNTEQPATAPRVEGPPAPTVTPAPRHQTSRTVGWRLRWLTVHRDGHRCRSCGSSPATTPGVELEVDHVVPWSAGGETVLENLQALCRVCNGGKSNLTGTPRRGAEPNPSGTAPPE